MAGLSNHQHIHGVTNPEKSQQICVIMVPFPAQGHLNQMLQVSCLVSSYGIPVYYVGSAIHNRQSKLRANGLNPVDVARVHFQDLPVPPFPSPPPNPKSPCKFPSQLQPAWDATLSLRQPLADYVRSMASEYRRVVVVHDRLIAVVIQDVASIPNAESYAFNCISASCQAKLIFEQLGQPLPLQGLKELPPIAACISDGLQHFLGLQNEALEHRAGDIYNTCRLIEPFYLDLLESEEIAENRKSWAIGPILPAKLLLSARKSENRHRCLRWLDGQEPNSVIYVTFGTTTSLSDEEIKELAMGLDRSQQKFIWVLRDADKADIFDGEVRNVELPPGFEERVKGRGTVVRNWAPQPEILAHPSTGGFMSHCGWNSCVESIIMGVPMAAWPMHSDQPTNAVLITEVLRIGLVVTEWTENGEVVKASTVENVVRRLMASEEGNEVRLRAKELAAVVGEATEEGGASRRELDSFISHITRPGDPKPCNPTSSSAAAASVCCEISANTSTV